MPVEIALKRVDLPTFGKPTMPHCSPMYRVLWGGFSAAYAALKRPAQRFTEGQTYDPPPGLQRRGLSGGCEGCQKIALCQDCGLSTGAGTSILRWGWLPAPPVNTARLAPLAVSRRVRPFFSVSCPAWCAVAAPVLGYLAVCGPEQARWRPACGPKQAQELPLLAGRSVDFIAQRRGKTWTIRRLTVYLFSVNCIFKRFQAGPRVILPVWFHKQYRPIRYECILVNPAFFGWFTARRGPSERSCSARGPGFVLRQPVLWPKNQQRRTRTGPHPDGGSPVFTLQHAGRSDQQSQPTDRHCPNQRPGAVSQRPCD